MAEALQWQVGDVLRQIRERRGWTQQQLADEAKVNISTVVRTEKNRNVEKASLEALALALGLTLVDLHTLVPGAGAGIRRNVAANVKRLRESRGWSLDELAISATRARHAAGFEGVHAQAEIRDLERLGSADGSTISDIAFALGVSAEELMAPVQGAATGNVVEEGQAPVRADWRPFISYSHGTPTAGEVAWLDRDTNTRDTSNDIPLITEAQAGEGRIVYDDPASLQGYAERRVPRPEGVTDTNAFAVMVKGDSMLPVFKPGRYVVVSPNLSVASGDEVFVALASGERLIKIAHRANGGFVLESANPAYPPRFVKAEDVQVMYPVIWAKRKEG
jgi:phage repressor protein C with HTH and peptisase S24 domain/DNA-binding XRE family transcriptional regulator